MRTSEKMTFEALCDIERELALFGLSQYRRYFDTPPGTVSAGGAAVMGFAGHHFIGDGTNHWESQFTGALNLTEEGLASWIQILRQRKAVADQLGIKIIHLVAPEKQSILPEFRWMDPPATAVHRPVYRILSRFPEASAGIFYPADLLRAHAGIAELCWRSNSHWCTSSVSLVAQAIVQQFGSAPLSIEEIRFKRSVLQHDLVRHFHEDPPYEELIRVAPVGTVQEVELWKTEKRHSGSFRHIRNPNASSSDVLVIYCDSYSFDYGLDYALSYRFREVYVHWRKEISWDYAQSVKATHVLWQCAERFLGMLPNV
jgi:hypothetical protein